MPRGCSGAAIQTQGCPLLCRREEGYDRYTRSEDYYRRKDDTYYDRYRDHLDRPPLSAEGQCRMDPGPPLQDGGAGGPDREA